MNEPNEHKIDAIDAGVGGWGCTAFSLYPFEIEFIFANIYLADDDDEELSILCAVTEVGYILNTLFEG